MDRQLIKALIDALAASDLSELEYSNAGETLRLVKSAAAGTRGAASTPGTVKSTAVNASPPTVSPSIAAAEPQAVVVSAPLYGIVHLHRSPGDLPLVAPGQAVTAGQVLCLIEAMKVFTELRAERDGSVAAVLVETGQEVEAGQPLFRMH